MAKKIYGFEVNTKVINISSNSEQNATKSLVKNFWELIDASGKIELLGEVVEAVTE